MGQHIYRALVVDDEPVIREATVRAMSSLSFCCDAAGDGCEGMRVFKKRRHDLVVTDLRMPKKHGHALILELLQEPQPPHIVALTGVVDPRLAKDLLSRGVQDIVHKPVDYSMFAIKMLSIFEKQAWSNSLCGADSSQSSTSGHQLVTKIEQALELFSLCIPQDLDQALAAGTHLLTDPPQAAAQLMKRLLSKRGTHADRRREARIPLFSTAVVVPVNKDFEVQGEAFKMTFCDVSESGACLLHSRAIHAKYLALRWRSSTSPNCFIQVVMQVLRCNPIGPFYEIAGQFVMHD